MARRDYYSELPREEEFFSDFHHSFYVHPGNGQIIRRVNDEAIKLSIRNLILTNRYERLGDPDIGGNVRGSLFELMDSLFEETLKTQIKSTLENYEPRATIEDIIVNAKEDSNALDVSIIFSIKNKPEPIRLDLTLVRDR